MNFSFHSIHLLFSLQELNVMYEFFIPFKPPLLSPSDHSCCHVCILFAMSDEESPSSFSVLEGNAMLHRSPRIEAAAHCKNLAAAQRAAP